MAQCRLPFSFHVLAKAPPLRQGLLTIQGKRKRVNFEQEDGAPPPPEPRSVKARMSDPNVLARENPLGGGHVPHPDSAVDHRDSSQGVQSCEGSLSSSSQVVSVQNARPNSKPLSAWKLPRADVERTPTLTEVNPESGSISGGTTIWLKGIDFPASPPFVRFGDAVVPTVCSNYLPFGPNLITFLRLSLPATSLPVNCLTQPRQVSPMLRSQSIPSQIRLSMEQVSRNSGT